jgi:hypothetical protein
VSTVAAEVAESRARQGLPPVVVDPEAVRRIAAVIKAMERRS